MNDDYEVIQMPKILIEVVDTLDKYFKLHGNKQGVVDSKADWKLVEMCYDLFRISYPEDLKVFIATQKQIRYNLKNEDGSIKEKGGARAQHMMNIPQKMYQLINTFYPNQTWDRKFVLELAKHLPVFKVPKKL